LSEDGMLIGLICFVPVPLLLVCDKDSSLGKHILAEI